MTEPNLVKELYNNSEAITLDDGEKAIEIGKKPLLSIGKLQLFQKTMGWLTIYDRDKHYNVLYTPTNPTDFIVAGSGYGLDIDKETGKIHKTSEGHSFELSGVWKTAYSGIPVDDPKEIEEISTLVNSKIAQAYKNKCQPK